MSRRAVLAGLGAALGLAVVAPLLVPGTVLVQDMVFVPHQPWRSEWLGLASNLPRSVPADAFVSAATTLLPGAVVQRLVLLLAIALAGYGAARLLPSPGLLGPAAAAVLYAWNPYVAERLLMGHWALLVAYAALPWVLRAGLDVRAGRPRAAARLLLAVAAASLTATGGVLALVVALAAMGRTRRALPVALAAGALQLPWIVPSLLHPSSGTSDPAAIAAFAARAENWSGTLGSVLGLGGVWNSLAVPASRTTAVAPLLTLLVLVVAAAGLPVLVNRCGRPLVLRLGAVAAGALAVALLAAAPAGAEALAALVERVPGAGLLRDGQKWLPPYALLLALAFGLGVERLARARVPVALAALALLLPLATTPDLGWGVGGRLAAVPWPEDFERVRAALEQDDAPGDVVSLPFTAYRAYAWNEGRPSIDPTQRWLDEEVVFEDRLLVGDEVLEGEDPRTERVRAALAAREPLGRQGIGWAVVHLRTPGTVPDHVLRGAELVVDGRDLQLWRLPDVQVRADERPPLLPVVAADLVALAVLLGALWSLRPAAVRRRPAAADRP